MRKTFLFLAALLTATVMNLNAATVSNVKYIDDKGKEQTCASATVVADASSKVTWNAGWYVVNGADVKLTAGAICSGAVHLILADGAKLTSTGSTTSPAGIAVTANNSLTIYGQTNQTGELIASTAQKGAAIGGTNKSCNAGAITINGGIITATATASKYPGIGAADATSTAGTCTSIVINGGTVTATGGLYAAGIGGCYKGAGENITINGGIVTATGGEDGAGIGGGFMGSGSHITIKGGKVTATGGDGGAGIGGGNGKTGSDITINDGTVTATGGSNASGIGGGNGNTGSNITINGGEVTATGGGGGAGIGGGSSTSGSSYITINGGIVTATGGPTAASIGDGYCDVPAASNIFVDPSLTLKADGTNPPTTVIAHATITTDVASSLAGKRYATVTAPAPVITGVTLTGYNAAYDGENHSVQVSGTIAGDVIEFSGDSTNWQSTNPSFKGVVDTLIYVRVQRAGYQDWGGKAIIKITPKEISVSSTTVDLKEYDGTTTASFIDEGELEGVIAGDDVTVSATGEFEDKNAGDDKEVTITYTLSGTDAPNYILKSASTTMSDIVIFARSIDVNTDVVPKIYDGNTDATVNAVLINVIEGDDVTVSATGVFEDANVGFNEVHVTFILSGDDAGNYQLQEEEKTAYGEITAREITMTSASDSKQFDGDPLTNATITFSGDGFVGSDTVSCTVTGSQTAVGTSPNYFTYTFSGSSEDNYAFTKVEGTLEVTAAPVAETYGRKLKTAGSYGTICLAKKFTSMEGVEGLYKPATKDASKLYCEEVELKDVKAGYAYIFKANADSVTFVLDGEAVPGAIIQEGEYLFGSLVADYTLTEESDFYGLSGNTIIKLAAGSTIKQNCAVIDLDNVPAATSAPSRRYVAFGINGTNTPTGLVQNAECTMQSGKMIINGQLIIIRDGKKFNAMGQEL